MDEAKRRLIRDFEREHNVRVFVTPFEPNAHCAELGRWIVISRQYAEVLSPDALLFLLYHELAHIREKHQKYRRFPMPLRLGRHMLEVGFSAFMAVVSIPGALLYTAGRLLSGKPSLSDETEAKMDCEALREVAERRGRKAAILGCIEVYSFVLERDAEKVTSMVYELMGGDNGAKENATEAK